MTVRCTDCGGSTTWDDHASSAICTSCGTLTDPAQSILISHLEPPQNAHSTRLWDPAAPTTLKSFRTGSNWDLSGQGIETKDRKNNVAMVEFINSLASSINASTISPRATVLFNQAMSTGRYRWGRKSKLVAGACLALALREYNRPDALYDLAYLLGEALPTLVRSVSSVAAALGISFGTSDPSIYFPSLQTHLSNLLQDAPRQSESASALPASLMAQLKPLSLHAVVATATSLATLFARLVPDLPISGLPLPVPPTACAMFLLALEAELRAPLEHLGDLATCLSLRCHARRGVLMTRYKLFQEEVLTLIHQLPWLDKYQSKNGRAKIAKRAVVARGLKDVLVFQDEIWRGRLKPIVLLDGSDHENDDYPSEPPSDNNISSVPRSSNRTKVPLVGRPCSQSNKRRRKISHKPLHDAAEFLLDPLSAPIPSFSFIPPLSSIETLHTVSASPSQSSSILPSASHSSSVPEAPVAFSTGSCSRSPSLSSIPSTHTQLSLLPLTSYLLAAPTSTALTSRYPPTRLQVLAASRGGEENITNEELFGEGELERLFRNEEEIQSLRETFGWGDWEDKFDDAEGGNGRTRKRRKKRDNAEFLENMDGPDGSEGGEDQKRRVSKRVDLEALARFLEDPAEEKDNQYDYRTAFMGLRCIDEQDEKDDEDSWQDRGHRDEISFDIVKTPYTPTGTSRTHAPAAQGDGEVVLNEWRPLSPECGIHYGGHNRYEEEYD